MPKKFKVNQEVMVGGTYKGRVLGSDWLNPTMLRVELLEGPQKGNVLSYKPDMLK